MYMRTLSVAEARANFSKIVDAATKTHERFEITRNGGRVAVLLGADDLDAMVETIAVLGDSELLAELREGLNDLRSGRTVSLSDVAMEGPRREEFRT
jgi:antitoxin YefM